MTESYLTQESIRVNVAERKRLFRLTAAFVIIIAFLYFLLKESIDLNDPANREILFLLKAVTGIMVLAVVVGLFKTRRPAVNGENLILPFREDTKEAVAEVIDREALEGKIQVEEYIYEFEEGKRPHGEKIVLLPSYLLICSGGRKIKAIPRDKIYWICAQVGKKGGPFIVQLMIFTEKKIFTVSGVEIEHVQKIADKIYQYIPNVFNHYDPFILSYELEKLFTKDREEFLEFYRRERESQRSDEREFYMARLDS